MKAEVCVICQSRRHWQIIQTEALMIPHILREPEPRAGAVGAVAFCTRNLWVHCGSTNGFHKEVHYGCTKAL